MNIYIDKPNLLSVIHSVKNDRYSDCIKMLKNCFSIYFTFSKDDVKKLPNADKVDIMYVLTNEILRNGTEDKISEGVIECIKKHKAVSRELVKNENDRILVDFSFAFDLNYDVCLKDYKNGFIEFYNHLGNK